MQTPRLIAAFGFVCAMAAGCAGPAVPAAGNQFDGTYQGSNHLVSGGGFMCEPMNYPDTVTVQGGRFEYRFVDSLAKPVPVPVQVAADGSFSGQRQYGTEDLTPRALFLTVWVTVTGRFDGPTLEATAADYRCTRQLHLESADRAAGHNAFTP